MTEENLFDIGRFLISQGYDINLNDQLWMEEYRWGEHSTREIAKLMDDYTEYLRYEIKQLSDMWAQACNAAGELEKRIIESERERLLTQCNN